ncbi:hypothetical protein ES288_D02G227700v1 [Gossypium darwinii]|uniref:Uncharacterized protein n=2 Tax=Gossypium TaxID=3633 RepID=A0A5D2M0U3_GOSTO|nr:hypothetical protein ES288_D02G227700v1 [Gossypium darwinii]TYH84938.1 hypothetical protein ES332_D02G230900v1 [Gossypium tomentosum]
MMEGAKRHYEKDRPRSESAGKSSQVGWVSGTGDRETIVKQVGLGDKQKLREAEKAENLMHLICFGPCHRLFERPQIMEAILILLPLKPPVL